MSVCRPPLQPEQINRRRWLRFLPFWLFGWRLLLFLLLVKGPVLPASRPQGCAPRSAAPPAPHRPGLPGAHDRGGLQLSPRQQLRPLLSPHAALHQRTSANMRGNGQPPLTALPTTPVTPVNVSSSPCALKKPQTATWTKLLRGDVKTCLTNIAHPLTWCHLNPLILLSRTYGPSPGDP